MQTQTIEEQLAELRKKAAMWDNMKAELTKHADGIIALGRFLESFSPQKTRRREGEYRDMVLPLHKSLLNGDKMSYTIAEVQSKLGLDEYYQGVQAFEELCKMDGVEKIRDGKNVKAIFHVNTSG